MACSLPFPDTMMEFALDYLTEHKHIANYEKILNKNNTYKVLFSGGKKSELWSWKNLAGYAIPPPPPPPPPPVDKVVNKIWEEIKKKYTDIENLIEDTKILYGLAQSGKSMYLLCAVWGINFVLKRKSILILMNSSGSYAQIKKRDIPKVNEYIEEICGELGVENYKSYQLTGEGFQGVRENVAIREGRHVFLYAMGNPTQLGKLLRVVGDIKPYHLVIDESDTLIKNCLVEKQRGIPTGRVYQSLVEQAEGVVNVTATPFANFNQAGQEQGVIILPPPATYRGIGNGITIHNFEGDARKNVEVACEVVLRALRESPECPGKYTALLAVTHEKNQNHEVLAKQFKRASPTVRVFTYDSRGGNTIAEVGENFTMFQTTHVRACDLFDEFETLGGGKKYVIVSGFKAGRAESFRPSELRVNDAGERISGGNGGLTCMVYDPSETAHCAAKIQAMRLSGNYALDYPEIQLWVRKEVEENILGELGNLAKIASTCTEVCDTRTAMEGEELVVVGKHDRAGVDDTKLERPHDIFLNEYDTLEEGLAHFPGNTSTPVCMTEDVQWVEINDMTPETLRSTIVRKIKSLPGMANNAVHVPLNDDYYERVFNLEFRYKNQINDVIAGNGGATSDSNRIPYVVWKPTYRKDTPSSTNIKTIDGLDENQIYYFKTTRNKVRIYIKNVNIRVGTLTH